MKKIKSYLIVQLNIELVARNSRRISISGSISKILLFLSSILIDHFIPNFLIGVLTRVADNHPQANI